MFSPKYLPEIKQVWSLCISLFRVLFILLAIAPDPILYTQFNREIGL